MYLLGSFVVIIFNFIGQFPLTYYIIESNKFDLSISDPLELLRKIESNLQLLLILIPFLFSFIGFWLIIKKLHNSSLVKIATIRKKIDFNRIIFSFVLWGTLIIFMVLFDYFIYPDDYKWNFKLKEFLIMLPIAFLFIPIQTSLEEFIFRGYLMEGFASLLKNSWMPLIFTSLIFGLLHIYNPEVDKLGHGILIYYIGTGLFLGVLSIMDQGIELSIGFHAANNLVTALLVTSTWTVFQTESILIDVSEPSLFFETVFSLLILYPLFLYVMSRKYNWNNWKEKIF
ncbi:MAG: CPBP family intramembrane metalloprotease domain-containing protein [Flavobacteriaceae bacterium]|nr:CPBP family intramembrane metalloprotease domain-containing protein [Flavobacteriaceae bacterium]